MPAFARAEDEVRSVPSRPRLLYGTSWMLLGHGGRFLLQAGYFVLLARLLGANSMGSFVATLALANVLAPFAGLGSGQLLVRDVASGEMRFGAAWGRALRITVISGVGVSLVAVFAAALFLSGLVPLTALICIVLNEVVFARLTELCAQSFQAHHQLSRAAQIQMLVSASRLLVVGSLWATSAHRVDLVVWSWLYLVSGAGIALVSIAMTVRRLGVPESPRTSYGSTLREGIPFSVSLSSQGVYNDIDKSLLGRVVSMREAGLYGAAYRIVDVSITPVRALMYAAYARFFEAGVQGKAALLAFTRRLLPWLAGYGFLTSLSLYTLAPAIPVILGQEYAESAPILRTLAVLPLLRALQALPADALTGAGYQGQRSLAQVLVAVINALLSWFLIGMHGWAGAAWASIISDTVLMGLLWALLLAPRRRDRIEVVVPTSARDALNGVGEPA